MLLFTIHNYVLGVSRQPPITYICPTNQFSLLFVRLDKLLDNITPPTKMALLFVFQEHLYVHCISAKSSFFCYGVHDSYLPYFQHVTAHF